LAGQVIASIVIDHFGLIRVPVHELNIPRLAGAVLIVVGVALVQSSRVVVACAGSYDAGSYDCITAFCAT
jgi:hypothetical protein